MDCSKIEEILSPYLDGELARAEADTVKTHLDACSACREQYEDMVRLSEALRSASSSVPAPPGFAAAVMDKIRAEEKVIVLPERNPWFKRHWRQAIAGIAAAALLAFSLSVPNNGPQVDIADNPPVLVQPGGSVPAPDAGDSADAPNTQPGDTLPTQDHSTGNGHQGSPRDDNDIQIAQNRDPGVRTPLVLLNKDRALTTTLLEVRADDSNQAQQRAAILAGDVKAQVQNLGQQVDENGSHTVLKITVAKSQAAQLIRGLEGLGTLTNKEVTKTDINSQFANKLSQYQNLLSQRSTLQETGELATLDARILALETELKNWDQQADQETIVLWLQK